jgi:hypothetical protein
MKGSISPEPMPQSFGSHVVCFTEQTFFSLNMQYIISPYPYLIAPQAPPGRKLFLHDNIAYYHNIMAPI